MTMTATIIKPMAPDLADYLNRAPTGWTPAKPHNVHEVRRMHGRAHQIRALIDQHDKLQKVTAERITDGEERAERLLEGEWERAVRQILNQFYIRPIENLPENLRNNGNKETLRRFFQNYYRSNPVEVTAMRQAIGRYGSAAFNLGGQIGLNAMSLTAEFALQDDALAQKIDRHAERLVSTTSRMSLTRTTSVELAAQLSVLIKQGISFEEAFFLLSTYGLVRSAARAIAVSETESVRMSRLGMASSFVGNDVTRVTHVCEPNVEELCTTRVCIPLCGEQYDLSSVLNPLRNIPSSKRIPLHPHCRCWYRPVLRGWTAPATIWTGFGISTIPGL